MAATRSTTIRQLLRQSAPQLQPRLFASQRCFSLTPARLEASGDDPLLASIKSGLKDAMRAKDKVKSTVLRSLLSDHQYTTLSSSPSPLSTVLQKSISKRREAATQFRAADRTDLADAEEKEAEILTSFLPAQLTPEKLEEVARGVLEDLKAQGKVDAAAGKRALGMLIKGVNEKVDKASTTGKAVSAACEKALAAL